MVVRGAHPFGKLRAGSSKIAKGAASVGVVHGWAILPRYEVIESNKEFFGAGLNFRSAPILAGHRTRNPSAYP